METVPFPKYTLDDLIRVQDALAAMKDGLNRGEFVICHKQGCRQAAWSAWSTAKNVLAEYGTIPKSLNAVQREIEAYR